MEFKKIMGKAVLLCAVVLAAACSQDEFDETVCPDSGTATLRLSAVGFTGETRLTRAETLTGESAINGVWVAQFASGKVIKGPTYYSTIGAGNTVEAELDSEASTVYAVANVASDLFASFDQTNGTETQFKAATVKYASEITCDGTSSFLPMVGSTTITANDTQVQVTMTRAVARIDFTVTHDAAPTATFENLQLTECWLEYVPNNSSIEAKGPDSSRVYPTAADAQFFANDASDEKAKFVYGKTTMSLSKGGSKSVTWYVPENLAGENGSISFAKNKGEATAPDKYAMRIVVKGTCKYKQEEGTEVSFTIYPGQNATSSFNVQRNYVYTVTSTIKGLNLSDNRVTVHDFVDLTADGRTANCYMIHQKGKYKFKCNIAGNGKIFKTDVTSGTNYIAQDFQSAALSGTAAEILWQGSGNSYATGNSTTSVIKNVKLDGNYITFETADTFAEGNALIALKNNGTTVWSWHIWATAYEPQDNNSNVDTYTLSTTYATNPTEYVMRCNLGATGQTASGIGGETTAPQCYGLKYQWGRKDPFWHTATNGTWANGASAAITVKGNSNMVSTAIKNPTQFYINYDGTNYDWIGAAAQKNDYLWGNGARTDVSIQIIHGKTGTTSRTVNTQRGFKSAFDPCPVGWRVPPQGLWTNCGIEAWSTNYVAQSGSTPAYLKLLKNLSRTPINYPAAGYLHRDSGAVSNVGANGYYWSSSPYSTEVLAGNLAFYSGGVYPVFSNSRAYGFSVRCVRE